MKICDLTQFYSPVSGGVKRYVHEKVSYLHGHSAQDEHLLIIPGARAEMTANGRAKTYTIQSPLISRTSQYRALLRLGAIEEILQKERPDVIECGDPYQVAWKALASAKALHIPVVAFYHSHFPEAYLRGTAKFLGKAATDMVMDLSRRYVRNLYNRFARTLVPSPALGALLREWGVENVENVDLGVNTSVFKTKPDDSESTRAELGIPREQTLLLYVGRLAPEKNTRTLFEAFRILRAQHGDQFHLFATGDGTQRAELKKLITDFSNQPSTLNPQLSPITWLPYCPDTERLARIYRAADLFVHPGVQETFGLVTLEAQACGTPVVGIRGSYMDRIIHSDQTLWAVENTPSALARAIVDMSSQDLKKIGAAASAEVSRRYSWTRVFDRLFAIYRSVISS